MKSMTTRRSALATAVLVGALGIAPALTSTATAAKAGNVDRIAGIDRYETSANISKANYSPGVDVAYVASGLVFTDALSGAPVAGMKKGPVLLTKPDKLPASIEAELTRLQPKQIVVFGGTNSVMGAVMNSLRALTTGEVTRIAGQTRYSTSAKISEMSYGVGPATTYVASGEVFPDALSGASVAGKTSGPLLLIESDNVPGIVKKELERLASGRIVVLGGESTIDADTYAADAHAALHRQPVAGHRDVAPDQRRALQRLQLHQLAVQARHRGVELVDAADGVDLRHLAGDLRVVQRVHRVLVLHLRDQQLEEAILRTGLVLGRRAAAGSGVHALGQRGDRGHGFSCPAAAFSAAASWRCSSPPGCSAPSATPRSC